MKTDGAGKRHNKGKNRLDLVPVSLIEEVSKVLTKGAEKYDERNWERGMKFTTVYASMMRHILAWYKGEDFDKESGLSHLAHVACNAAFLIEYSTTCPELDDRPKRKEKVVAKEEKQDKEIEAVSYKVGDLVYCEHHKKMGVVECNSIAYYSYYCVAVRFNDGSDDLYTPHGKLCYTDEEPCLINSAMIRKLGEKKERK